MTCRRSYEKKGSVVVDSCDSITGNGIVIYTCRIPRGCVYNLENCEVFVTGKESKDGYGREAVTFRQIGSRSGEPIDDPQ